MNRILFWKLCASVALGTVALVYLISEASQYVESRMSLIADEHKQQMLQYRDQANVLVEAEDYDVLKDWLIAVEAKEQTYVTVVRLDKQVLVSSSHGQASRVSIRLGRQIDWPIHLYQDNPLIDLPLNVSGVSLVFELPDHMLPGRHWPLIHDFLHLVVPLLLMMLVSLVLYRHVMKPLGALEQATRRFSEGDYEARALPAMNGRSDELGRVAATFDAMASQVGGLIQTQRHLINDLSHELRTPLQRMELCLSAEKSPLSPRLKRETFLMRRLVEDTLTLAWLQNESPCLRLEPVDLSALLEAIADDARFEYPRHRLELQIPEELILQDSSERALNLALENIIRNALHHTPEGGVVNITVAVKGEGCALWVKDQGPGVPDALLSMIFKPFFRVDKSRDRDAGGFGLGLALAKRQIEGMGGSIRAENLPLGGLCMRLWLPVSSAQ